MDHNRYMPLLDLIRQRYVNSDILDRVQLVELGMLSARMVEIVTHWGTPAAIEAMIALRLTLGRAERELDERLEKEATT